MKKKIILISFFICLVLPFKVKAIDIAVVVNKNLKLDSISIKTLKRIYLKKKLFLASQKVVPVNLETTSKLRDIFQNEVLKMDNEELALYWNEKYFHGVKPPIVLKSEDAVIKFVSKVKNSIGYVSLEKAKQSKNIKIIKIIQGKKDGK